MGVLAAVTATGAARAGVGAELSIANDYRYRGLSLTDGRPAAVIGIDLDQGSGRYASGLVAIAPNENDRPILSAVRLVAGDARPIGAGLTLDGGVSVTSFRKPASTASLATPEAYLGLRRGDLALYLSYSPAYYASGYQTLYAEAAFSHRLSSRWRLFARAGLLTQLAGRPYSAGERANFGLGAATRVLGFGISAEVTTYSLTYFDGGPPRTALVITLTRAF